MCNDVSLIAGLRQAVKSTSAEICKAYNDFSQDTIGDALKSVLSRQLRIAEKLSSIEKLYSSQKSNKDYASSAEINAFKMTNSRQ